MILFQEQRQEALRAMKAMVTANDIGCDLYVTKRYEEALFHFQLVIQKVIEMRNMSSFSHETTTMVKTKEDVVSSSARTSVKTTKNNESTSSFFSVHFKEASPVDRLDLECLPVLFEILQPHWTALAKSEDKDIKLFKKITKSWCGFAGSIAIYNSALILSRLERHNDAKEQFFNAIETWNESIEEAEQNGIISNNQNECGFLRSTATVKFIMSLYYHLGISMIQEIKENSMKIMSDTLRHEDQSLLLVEAMDPLTYALQLGQEASAFIMKSNSLTMDAEGDEYCDMSSSNRCFNNESERQKVVDDNMMDEQLNFLIAKICSHLGHCLVMIEEPTMAMRMYNESTKQYNGIRQLSNKESDARQRKAGSTSKSQYKLAQHAAAA